jgi:hypothetical protein
VFLIFFVVEIQAPSEGCVSEFVTKEREPASRQSLSGSTLLKMRFLGYALKAMQPIPTEMPDEALGSK